MKEGKRLIFPGLLSWTSCFRESARNRERERDREIEREKEGHGDPSLMEYGCFIEFCVSIYTILPGSFFR